MDNTSPSPPAQPTYKTLRVDLETHEKIMRLAAHLNGSADDALRHLLGLSTVRVQVSEVQRDRWAEAAAEAGVSLPEFVKLRVESAIQFGFDPGTMGMIYAHVRALSTAAGVRPAITDYAHVRSTERRQP